MKILIVEDDIVQRAFLNAVCKKIKGVEVVSFDCMDDCIFEIAVTEESVIVITDIIMPKKTGVSLIINLQRFSNVKGLIIISGAEIELLNTLFSMALNIGIPFVKQHHKPIATSVVKKTLTEMMFAINFSAKFKDVVSEKYCKNTLSAFLMDNNFQPYFQLKICTKTLEVKGLEILSRLHINNRVCEPNNFKEELKSYNLITEYTYQILSKGISLLNSYNIRNIQLSINTECSCLQQPNFHIRIKEIIEKHNFPAEKLTLELTESESNISINLMANSIELRLMGVQLSVDNFGMGKSGLNEILNIPFKELKINQKLVSDFLTTPKSYHLIKAMVFMAKSLELVTVAEGVETFEQAIKLELLGVDLFQGFLFAKPVPIYELETVFEEVSKMKEKYDTAKV